MKLSIRNPVRLRDVPEHMIGEELAHKRWLGLTATFAFCITAFMIASTPLLSSLLGYGHPTLVKLPFLDRAYWFYHDAFLDGRFYPLHGAFLRHMGPGGFHGWIAYILIGLLTMLVCMTPQLFNPYEASNKKQGDVRWADDRTLDKMHERQQVGIVGGKYGNLGTWQRGKYKGKAVRLIETLSVLCLAPPGTGKTAGFILPSLVSLKDCSTIISDPKPELHEASAAHMSKTSHVFMLDWGKSDEPDKGLFYPRFNFLSPKLVPPSGPNRDTYLDTVAKTLIPDDPKASDSYFINRGRAALTAFMHFLVAKIGDAKNYQGIPDQWHGKEASIPMLSDWIAQAQFDAKAQSKNDAALADGQGGSGDPLSQFFEILSRNCNPADYAIQQRSGTTGTDVVYNAPRAFNEFVNLASTADKERSGILGTMDQSLLPFKNQAVAQRTSASDFTPDDFRGIQDPATGEWKPVCLYVCSNQAEAAAFSRITALLFEVLAQSLLTTKYGEFNTRTNRQLGPFPVCFVMEEFAKLPKMDAVADIPDVGRSMGVFAWFIAQSSGQIKVIYSNEKFEILTSTTAVKYILAQNDPATIELIQKFTGQTTIKDQKYSYTEGLSKGASPFASGRSEDYSAVNFFRNEDISAMAYGTHIVLAQGFLNRPMLLNTPFFFKDPEMSAKIYSRGKGTKGTQVLPDFIARERKISHIRDQKRMRRSSAIITKNEQQRAFRPPEAIKYGP
jgi:type IV secretion system protein VirD4